MTVDIISFAYAASVAAGGIIGYVKAERLVEYKTQWKRWQDQVKQDIKSRGSIPSLGAGLLFGSLLGLGAYQTTQNPNNYYLLLGTSSILGGIMGARFYNSGKIMPAGLITIMSYIGGSGIHWSRLSRRPINVATSQINSVLFTKEESDASSLYPIGS
uniref:Transmembrane protein 14C n=1 Tax=Timema tahoe TaxID=61484 RepID=A0A7R9I9E0_9NEOP|nr:unnamed protein product [Timema tahoe]